MSNHDKFKGVLPYASELFGVYQPLLGWKSKQTKQHLVQETLGRVKVMMLAMRNDPQFNNTETSFRLIDPNIPGYSVPPALMRTQIADYVQSELKKISQKKHRLPTNDEWKKILNKDSLQNILRTIKKQQSILEKAERGRIKDHEMTCCPKELLTGKNVRLTKAYSVSGTELVILPQGVSQIKPPILQESFALYPKTLLSKNEFKTIGAHKVEGTDLMVVPNAMALSRLSLKRESLLASTLNWLSVKFPHLLPNIFSNNTPVAKFPPLFVDPLANFDPETSLAVLSPIGLIHLYREYFFELDTFLGPPVGHVWLSPGGTVELIEVNTRRTLTERFTEIFSEVTTRSELATLEQDEISDAVKEENQRDINLGASASGGVNLSIAHAEASASYSMNNSVKLANESTHKRMRQQSQKLSSEIRRNFKTTFRTTTEVTDTSNRRYVVQNTTDHLVNYELRRKMRKVGVQVQHIGTQMCWQFFVPNPGDQLGIAELVHVAKQEDLKPENIKAPEEPVVPQPIRETITEIVDLPMTGPETDYSTDYGPNPNYPGELVGDEGDDTDNRLPAEHVFRLPDKGNGYAITYVKRLDQRGKNHEDGMSSTNTVDVRYHFETSKQNPNLQPNEIKLIIDTINPYGYQAVEFTFDVIWEKPLTVQPVSAQESEKKSLTDEKKNDLHAEYVKAVRERIKLAGEVPQRPSTELRQEERIVVYRNLIEKLMKIETDQKPFVTSELIRALFEVDKMLYFVAPEWWNNIQSFKQEISPSIPGEATPLTSEDKIGWGGVREKGRVNNYLITEESEPARMGSSLGWLLQLDGDNHRNAFLNSPWVKAIIPIRPGRELAALKWLQLAHIEGDDDLNAKYEWSNGKTIKQALIDLAREVKRTNEDTKNVLASEKVFEAGFDPLDGGFRATGKPYEVFDQWIEVLPTDQVVAVEYDSKKHI